MKLIPITLSALGIVVCQIHGYGFWVFLFASFPLGLAVSVLWEGLSVWLWWEGKKIKYIPTAFLLFGMVFQSVLPLLNESEQIKTAQSIQGTATETLDRLLTVVVEQERKGWKETLDKVLGVALAAPTTTTEKQPLPAWVLDVLVWVPLIGFPALYWLCLTLITGIRQTDKAPKKETADLPERLRAHIQGLLGEGKTYTDIAQKTGISRANLNTIVHHQRLTTEGRNVLGPKAMNKAATMLGVKP